MSPQHESETTQHQKTFIFAIQQHKHHVMHQLFRNKCCTCAACFEFMFLLTEMVVADILHRKIDSFIANPPIFKIVSPKPSQARNQYVSHSDSQGNAAEKMRLCFELCLNDEYAMVLQPVRVEIAKRYSLGPTTRSHWIRNDSVEIKTALLQRS
ncbi:unnamed protein product [Hermetia illucens]|uniref:Uncharacterized protein n=1 Tax=Hermetia illucens TaxID=343691 RepID=A0A7R8YY57_HERIL|nr:unnamed protein product [Hermetia illucens]